MENKFQKTQRRIEYDYQNIVKIGSYKKKLSQQKKIQLPCYRLDKPIKN